MGLIKLESDQSGFSGVFQGWMGTLPEGVLTTTRIRMQDKGEVSPNIPDDSMVRLVLSGRKVLETHLGAFREGIEIALEFRSHSDIYFEVSCGGAFQMEIEWGRPFRVIAGEEPVAQVA